jgi:hypothetical protein
VLRVREEGPGGGFDQVARAGRLNAVAPMSNAREKCAHPIQIGAPSEKNGQIKQDDPGQQTEG